MSGEITRREVLQRVTAAAAATATVVLMPPVVAAHQPLIPLPAPSTFPGCILIRDHHGPEPVNDFETPTVSIY